MTAAVLRIDGMDYAEKVLEDAKAIATDVVVIGWDHDGKSFFMSSIADGRDVLWLLESYKLDLLETGKI